MLQPYQPQTLVEQPQQIPPGYSKNKYDFDENGNIILYGGTSTGKTIFQKYLTQLYIKAGKYDINDIYIFTTNPYQWEDYNQENIYEEWGGKIAEIKNKVVKGSKRGLILFDDFNNEISVNTDKVYNDLMTRSRHYGIKCILLGHTPTNIQFFKKNNIEQFNFHQNRSRYPK